MAVPKIQLMAEASILTDGAFWAKVVGGAALIATAFGATDAGWITPAHQAELVGGLTMIGALAFQIFGNQGPVSLTGPISTPAPVTLPAGTHTVTVSAPVAPVAPPPVATVVTQAPQPQPGAPPVVQQMPPPVPVPPQPVVVEAPVQPPVNPQAQGLQI